MMTDPNTHTPLPLIFEPHGGFGGLDPDGEPWPFGYISAAPGVPIFELNHPGIRKPDAARMAEVARLLVAAPDLLEALRRIADDDPSEPDFDGYEPRRIALAAIAKAEGR